MNNQIPFTITNDSITVVVGGKSHVVRKGAPNFSSLRSAILDSRWDDVPGHLSIARSVAQWAKGRYSVVGDTVVLFDGKEIPKELNERILAMASKNEDPTPLFLFWEKLQKNPSRRSVQQLWPFLAQKGIPLNKDGNFLAYKGVRDDFKDVHSVTFDNRPGQVHEMPRNEISDDPNEACHVGFHVGALEYAKNFGARVVICEVDPADVVCIPYDHSHQKMRVSRYKVVGNHNGQFLPSTTISQDELDGIVEETEDELRDAGLDPAVVVWTTVDDSELDAPQQLLKDMLDGPKPDPTSFKVPTKFSKLHKMGTVELLKQSMDDLRRYASQVLKIVGAYRIPGGKVALVSAIEKVRG